MTDSRRPSDLAEKMMLRLPPGMRARIATAAQEAGRSANAEVVARLEKSFEDDAAAQQMAELVEQHAAEITDHEARIADLERRMEDVFHMSGWQDYGGNDLR